MSADEILKQGVEEAQAGHMKIALDLFQRVVELAPDHANGWYNLGLAEWYLQNTPKAIAAWERATELDHNHQSAWSNLGNALQKVGDLGKAVTAWRKTLQIDPAFEQAWYNLGVYFSKEGKHGEALFCMLEAQKHGDPFAARAIKEIRSFEQGESLIPVDPFDQLADDT